MTITQANAQLFDEVLDFLASSPTAAQIVNFQPSEVLQERVRYLLEANQNGMLTAEEQTELEDCSRLNHFMSMLKVRARNKLAGV